MVESPASRLRVNDLEEQLSVLHGVASSQLSADGYAHFGELRSVSTKALSDR
jgi:hypothetical protein